MSETFIQAANAAHIPLEVLHRVASMASGGMDTLPHNGAVITLLAVTGLTHRTSYRDIFAVTLIKTAAVFVVIGGLLPDRPVLTAPSTEKQRPMTNSTHPLLSAFQDAERGKVVSAADAVRLIRDGDTVATGGFVGIGFAEEIAIALEERFLSGNAEDAVGRRQPARSHPRLCRRPRRRQGQGPEPSRPRRARPARHRRPLGSGAEAAAAGHRQPDRGLQPAAGGDHAALPRHRRAQAGPALQHRAGHLRRPPLRRRQAQRAHHRGARRADADRRRRLPVLQVVPDPRRDHPRHDRRSRRQRHDGKGGPHAGGAGHRHRRAQLRRHRHRPGRAHRRARQPQPAPGQDPGHPGRLRRRRPSRESLADVRRALQRVVRRRDPGADERDRADGDERAQDHRPPGGARADAPTASSTSASACPRAWRASPTKRRSST